MSWSKYPGRPVNPAGQDKTIAPPIEALVETKVIFLAAVVHVQTHDWPEVLIFVMLPCSELSDGPFSEIHFFWVENFVRVSVASSN